MAHCFLFAPFADAARQRQYEAVCEVLELEVAAPTTLLLGNLDAVGIALDAVVIRPRSITALVLEPRNGHLSVPTLEYGAWKLNGQPLPGRSGADNPFDQYQQNQAKLATWLSQELHQPAAELPPLTGMVLFEAPLSFGPEVERQLRHYPGAGDFQLLSNPQLLPRRLWQLAQPEALLAEHELQEWATRLMDSYQTDDLTDDPAPAETEAAAGFWTRKLRQFWGWLGAEDVPADPPYGAPLPMQPAEQQQEQQRLEQLRQELQQQLVQQQQAAATREAGQAQELERLRQQVAQTEQSDAARRAEQQQKALEEALRTVRAEAAARNEELDARIQQLSKLLEQLRHPAATPLLQPPLPTAAQPSRPTAPHTLPPPGRPAKSQSLVRLERIGLLVLVLLLGLVVGIGGVKYFTRPAERPHAPTRSARHTPAPTEETEAAPDSIAADDSVAAPATLPEPEILNEEELEPQDPEQIMRPPSDSAARALENE
ncbi:hypothetical protein MUN82_09285 [Hymenobacter aerilatus]|uniref:NERD domain-containing protein n=1 Tax=Hymenobacter aerilatus TaxID=2932251 RepID=A0A8T9SZH6_9BACT|nr:hypothetical protein [Hymenobacter aerilatus]UOR07275.1 hypothetical protein MUN82_09285 [Hymenobacter aerilatus]